MIIFNVVKEQHGWAIRMGERMTTPFWSRDLAVWEANRLADDIRRHGELTEVIVEGGNGQSPGRDAGGPKSRTGFRFRPERTGATMSTFPSSYVAI